jgi:uncharacterized repeat protein (TIGR01451 family)
MNRQNNMWLTRGLSALIVLASALWSMVPAAPGASRVAVPLLSRKTARATGDDTALAVTTGGSQTCSIWNNALYCWGFNMYGQIGDGTTNVRYTPTLVQGMDSGVTDVSAGSRHTCAIKNGALYCWGSNSYGQLGDGTTTNRLTPVAVQGMSSGVTDIAAGDNHTCAIKSGALFCWGYNAAGQLGDGTTIDRNIPVAVQYMSSGVTAIALSNHNTFNHRTCAIKNSALYCWGDNYTSALGYTTSQTCSRYYNHPCSLLPGLVTNMSSNVTAVDAGADHTCAVRNGALYCWGWNIDGQVGDGTYNNTRPTPVAVLNMSNNVTSVSAGSSHTCAIRSSAPYCWGSNWAGQIGDGTTTRRTVPAAVQNMGNNVTATSAGGAYTCAIKSAEEVYCWGDNFHGQLGDGTQTSRSAPVRVIGLSPFRKASPANEAIGLPTALVLRWGSRSGADHYRYCVSSMPGCIPDVSAGSSLSVTLNLSPGNYHWQVRACLTSDCSNFADANNGTHWSFSVSPYRAEIARSHSEIPASDITTFGGLTVTLQTWDNQPVYAAPIQLETSRADVDAIAPLGGTTNRKGQFFMTIASLAPGTSVVSLTSRLYPGVVLTRTTVRFTQYISSTLSASPPYLRVDSSAGSRLRLSLVGSDGFPASNKTVAFFSSRPQDQITPPTIQTDSNGRAEVQIRSTLSGTAVITVHNLTDNIALPLSTTVRFIPTQTQTVAAKVIAIPDVITTGMTTNINAAVFDAQTGKALPFYPVHFVNDRASDNLTIVDRDRGLATLQANISGTAVVTAIDPHTNLPLGRTEVKVVSGCPFRPVILDFVPSFALGPDVSYPHLVIPSIGFAIPLESDVTVDWGGCRPGKITFALSNGNRAEIGVTQPNTETIKTHYALRSFNLNEHLPIGLSEMTIEAHTSDGLVSEPYRIKVQGGEVPWWFILAFGEPDPADFPQGELVAGNLITYTPLFAIARIWPNPGGWRIEPKAVLDKVPNTQYTDNEGKARDDAKDLIKNHSTKIMLRGSMNFWAACEMPPSFMLQLFASKKEFANLGPVTLGGMLNTNLTLQPDRNILCYAFMPANFNEAYYRQARGSLSMSVDLYTEFREPLVTFLAKFFPPVNAFFIATCIDARLMTFVQHFTDFHIPDCKKWMGEVFGEVYVKIGAMVKAGAKMQLEANPELRLDLLELSGEFGPKLAAGYEGALLGGWLYVNAEANAVPSFQIGSSRPIPAVDFAPMCRLRLNAEAFITVNFGNLWHWDPKWTYSKYWDLAQVPPFDRVCAPPGLMNTTALAGSSTATYQLREEPGSIKLSLIPPPASAPTYAGFRLPARTQAFAQTSFLAAQNAQVGSSATVTTILASGSLTYSQTSLAHDPASGRSLLVWTQDDPNGPLGGSREIFYSLWDGADWSVPQAITSDDVHDLAPKVSWLSSDKAIVVWTRMRQTLEPEESVVDGMDKMEIAYAIYDANTDEWSDIQSLTDDDRFDHNPTVGRNPASGQALVAWVSKESNGFAIETARFDADGQLLRQEQIAQDSVGVGELAVALSDDRAAIAFTRFVKHSESTPIGSQLFTTVWDVETNSWSNPEAQHVWLREQNDAHPSLLFDDMGQLWLMFNRTGLAERREDTDGDGQLETVGYDKVNSLILDNLSDLTAAYELPWDDQRVLDIRLMRTDRGLMALALAEERGQIDLYALVADSGFSNWSKPIRLINDLASETSVEAQVGNAGELLAAYIRTDYRMVTTTNEINGTVFTTTKRQPVGTDLVALSRVFGTQADVTIPPGGITVTVPNDRPLPGTPVTVSVTVANQGEAYTTPSVRVNVYDGDPNAGGSLLFEDWLELAAGFTDTLSFEWTLPQTNAVDLHVVLDQDNNLAESNEDNNVAAIRLFGPQYVLEGIAPTVVDTSLEVMALIDSIGTTATLPSLLTVTVSLSDSVLLTQTVSIPAIAPSDRYTALTSLDLSTLPSGTYTVTAMLDVAGEENVAHNVIRFLPNLAFESESLDTTDLTVPLIRVEGVVRNTSPFTVTDALVAVFDPARATHTGLVATTTIPLIKPGESVPVSLLVREPMLCGLSVWVNPYGLSGTFAEQRLSDNVLYKSGSEEMCTRAGYVLSTRSGIAPLTVVFTNTSTPNTTGWEWDFGDGTTSTERDPGAHTYAEPGVYTVTLRATSPYTTIFWQEPMTIRVYEPVVADFESNTRVVAVGEVVSFTNRSTGDIATYAWDFGDGNTSASYEPLHVYDQPGHYTVTLSVDGLGGRDTVTKTSYIAVYGAPATVTLTASPAVIFSDGISRSVVIATVRDESGEPVPDAQVNFLAGIGRFSPVSGTTDANGQVTATLTSLVPGTENVFATVGTLVARTLVTYQLPPASQLGLNGSSVVATRTLGAVRKNDLITYTLTITNNGDGTVTNILMVAPIPDGTVYVDGSASGGNYAGLNANNLFGPQVTQNAVAWSGSLAPGAAHTLSYVVQVVILEGQIVNQPRVFVNNEDAGINLGSTVQVEARKAHIPIVRRQ